MHLVHPKANSTWRPFWGCNYYPLCDGSRSISKEGKTETDAEWMERMAREEYDEGIAYDYTQDGEGDGIIPIY